MNIVFENAPLTASEAGQVIEVSEAIAGSGALVDASDLTQSRIGYQGIQVVNPAAVCLG